MSQLSALRRTTSFVATFDAIVQSRGKRTVSSPKSIVFRESCLLSSGFCSEETGHILTVTIQGDEQLSEYFALSDGTKWIGIFSGSFSNTFDRSCHGSCIPSSCSAFLKELKLKVMFSVFRDTKQRLQHTIYHHYRVRWHFPDLLRTRFPLLGHIWRIPGLRNRGRQGTGNWDGIPEARTTWPVTYLETTSRAETKSVWTEWTK